MPVSRDRVMEVLHTCYDPEIPIDIVDLGLVYDVEVKDDVVHVKMTLTSQGCPSAQQIPDDMRRKLSALEGVREASVEVVWDPPWHPDRISPEGKQKLGLDI